jgi:hypothetical protein
LCRWEGIAWHNILYRVRDVDSSREAASNRIAWQSNKRWEFARYDAAIVLVLVLVLVLLATCAAVTCDVIGSFHVRHVCD